MLNRKLPFIFLFAVLVSACDAGKMSEPEINKPKMQAILTDIQIAEVYATMVDDSLHYISKKNMDSLAKYYSEILTHHKVDYATFRKSIQWYKANPDQLDSVYNKLIPTLSELEAKYPAKN